MFVNFRISHPESEERVHRQIHDFDQSPTIQRCLLKVDNLGRVVNSSLSRDGVTFDNMPLEYKVTTMSWDERLTRGYLVVDEATICDWSHVSALWEAGMMTFSSIEISAPNVI